MASSSVGHRHPSSLPLTNLRHRSGMNPKQPLLPSTVPSYNVPIEDKHVDSVVHPKEVLRQMSWGIFQVAYSEPVHQLSLGGFRQRIRDLSYSAPSAGRLLLEIFRTARTPVAVHLLAAVLLIIAPAFSLYLSATILGIVCPFLRRDACHELVFRSRSLL